MKRKSFFAFGSFVALCFCLLFTQACATGNKKKPKFLGKIDPKNLSELEWFTKNYNHFDMNPRDKDSVSQTIHDHNIIIFLGTWCGDSKREVPKMIKILDSVNFNKKHLEIIGVGSSNTKFYKKSPTGEEAGRNITHVPTIIFLKNGKEVNRIVESPQKTLLKDIIDITHHKNYRPNYH